MTALAIALTALSAALLGGLLTVLAWYRGAIAASQRLAGDLDLVGDDRDRLAARVATLEEQHEHEVNLRAVAEAQRNSAEQRVTELLVDRVRDATPEEINALVRDAFTSPLSLVPVSKAPAPAGRDGLLDPWANVQPPKPAG